ncbi:MAG: biotin--[acetyl-CoA-carboxylase] ligase [Hyphomicrobiales bacterium]|nr:biotin--[acetyl-CoA-carboxylase] ligase [Hyphomicrobiales bacterium]MDE2113719.1 biotin--[acetyl-CoA-carboxylase] ligase [Hyphomicrobiales bacterium]
MELARTGNPGPIWVVADEQTGGRGRHGRVWIAPRGNLNASLLLIDPAPPARLPELGFVAGVALAQALHDTLGGDRDLKIKWPNDMVYKGAKLSGLMLEGSRLADGNQVCIIGIGVNCEDTPLDIGYAATNLTKVAGRTIKAGEILARLTHAMDRELGLYARGANFGYIRERWLGFAAGLGGTLRVQSGQRTTEGRFETIDSAGRLVLKTDGGRVAIEAGDVFLPNAHA